MSYTIENGIEIVKASGEREVFDARKLERSLRRAGAAPELSRKIAKRIESRVKEGMSAKEIYRLAFSFLRKAERPLAARYGLKKAILELGPEGYPFEKFVGKILERRGYKVRVGQIVQGKCVSHEVDLIAEKPDECLLVECKFHNRQGVRSDVKVALYVKARFEDIRACLRAGSKTNLHQAWLVTNTKFTKDAIQYARCEGMKIIGWKYPPGEGLEKMIEESGLHPLTVLPALSSRERRALLGKGFVLCQDIAENPEVLTETGIKGFRQKQIISDIGRICR